MNVRVEVSSRNEFTATGQQLVEYLQSNEMDFQILEDHVGFGNEEFLIIGITFVIQAVAEGLSYDVAKHFLQSSILHIRNIYNLVPDKAKNETFIYIETQDGRRRHEIQISNNKGDVEIALPDLKIVVRSSENR